MGVDLGRKCCAGSLEFLDFRWGIKVMLGAYSFRWDLESFTHFLLIHPDFKKSFVCGAIP